MYNYCHALCCLNLMGQKHLIFSSACIFWYKFCSTADVDLKEVFDENFASYYIWPARMSRSIRSALYVPGSSLKSSLNIEYALPKKDTELNQFQNPKLLLFRMSKLPMIFTKSKCVYISSNNQRFFRF